MSIGIEKNPSLSPFYRGEPLTENIIVFAQWYSLSPITVAIDSSSTIYRHRACACYAKSFGGSPVVLSVREKQPCASLSQVVFSLEK